MPRLLEMKQKKTKERRAAEERANSFENYALHGEWMRKLFRREARERTPDGSPVSPSAFFALHTYAYICGCESLSLSLCLCARLCIYIYMYARIYRYTDL
jgi:hypothetical protein